MKGSFLVNILLISCLVITSYQFRTHRLITESARTEGPQERPDKADVRPVYIRPSVEVFLNVAPPNNLYVVCFLKV